MIILVSTASHRYTHTAVGKRVPAFRQVSYPLFFARRSLPRATYIFSDFDRLGFYQLELAAHVYRVLAAAGCRVLNDPASVLQRLPMLRRLHREGVNSFNAWPADEADTVDCYPVFLRTRAAHRGTLTGLLDDRDTLLAARARLVAEGYPLADMMVVEYRAAPVRDGVFRKHAAYRIGDRIVAGPSVHQRDWVAKYGEEGAAGAEGYVEDLRTVRDNPHGATLERAFALAGIDYGRVDYGVVDGRPEIYEINTNPMTHALSPHSFEDRATAMKLTAAAVDEAFGTIDTPSSGERIRIPRPASMTVQHRRFRLFPGYQWLP